MEKFESLQTTTRLNLSNIDKSNPFKNIQAEDVIVKLPQTKNPVSTEDNTPTKLIPAVKLLNLSKKIQVQLYGDTIENLLDSILIEPISIENTNPEEIKRIIANNNQEHLPKQKILTLIQKNNHSIIGFYETVNSTYGIISVGQIDNLDPINSTNEQKEIFYLLVDSAGQISIQPHTKNGLAILINSISEFKDLHFKELKFNPYNISRSNSFEILTILLTKENQINNLEETIIKLRQKLTETLLESNTLSTELQKNKSTQNSKIHQLNQQLKTTTDQLNNLKRNYRDLKETHSDLTTINQSNQKNLQIQYDTFQSDLKDISLQRNFSIFAAIGLSITLFAALINNEMKNDQINQLNKEIESLNSYINPPTNKPKINQKKLK